MCGFKFTLVGGGINSEQTGINNFVFNCSLQDIFATEYEELEKKTTANMDLVLTVENAMSLLCHIVAFSEMLQSNMG